MPQGFIFEGKRRSSPAARERAGRYSVQVASSRTKKIHEDRNSSAVDSHKEVQQTVPISEI